MGFFSKSHQPQIHTLQPKAINNSSLSLSLKKSSILLVFFFCEVSTKMKMMGSPSIGSSKRRLSSRGPGGALREQKAKLYIIRRCVVMLLCWHD
ncbi:hypothetical protein EUGRSUZ_G02348 [Eucalyptus grandis]|uniref:Uncharacterized protein n=2 Tax=Eucalyptus grandis TaxID=71139 RepID=A0ACC3K5Y1_EUCGR|nr:hypothetical protein EUGRSUZ_G02348 [Eucalyptus grandis]